MCVCVCFFFLIKSNYFLSSSSACSTVSGWLDEPALLVRVHAEVGKKRVGDSPVAHGVGVAAYSVASALGFDEERFAWRDAAENSAASIPEILADALQRSFGFVDGQHDNNNSEVWLAQSIVLSPPATTVGAFRAWRGSLGRWQAQV